LAGKRGKNRMRRCNEWPARPTQKACFMIVVVANYWDPVARAFASRWADHNVGVLTARDLSLAGWSQSLSVGDTCTAIVEGTLVPQAGITGVLTRLPCVFEEELFSIAPEDRAYVAAEMTAFLLFWLSSLGCRVLNRPTPACLSGPNWRRENWVRAAAQAEIPIEPVHRRAALPGRGTEEETGPVPSTVIVVGERSFGETDEVLQSQARRLAEVAEVELLAVRFSGPECGARFVSADVYPDLADDQVAGAVLDYLEPRLEAWT
jgi:hypothetical protein